MTTELIRAVRPFADGIHLYALGWEELVPEILKASGLLEPLKAAR